MNQTISHPPFNWDGRPYHSLDSWLKKKYHAKVYKLSLDGQMTCPNRDGTLGNRGCIFCSAGGSGEFSVKYQDTSSIARQIQVAKGLVARKG